MKALLCTAVLLISAPAFAITGFLEGEQQNGSVKYCKYSNGVILTVASYQLCPLSTN